MEECRVTVERTHPHLTEWVMTHGWIESGEVLAFWQAHGGEALVANPISGDA